MRLREKYRDVSSSPFDNPDHRKFSRFLTGSIARSEQALRDHEKIDAILLKYDLSQAAENESAARTLKKPFNSIALTPTDLSSQKARQVDEEKNRDIDIHNWIQTILGSVAVILAVLTFLLGDRMWHRLKRSRPPVSPNPT